MTDRENITAADAAKGFLKKHELHRYAEYAVRGLIGYLLSHASFGVSFSPFGAAFAGAAPLSPGGIITSVSCIIGYLTGGPLTWALKYISIIIITAAVRRILTDTRLSSSQAFAPAVVFTVTAFIGIVYAAETGWDLVPTVMFTAETFLAGGCTFFYDVALSPWETDDNGTGGRICHGISSVILLGTVLMSLSGYMLFGVLSPGRTLALLSVMLVSFRGGIGVGCAVGAVLGAAMDISSGTTPLMTGAYAMGAAVSGIFSKNGRIMFTLAFVISNAITVVCAWDSFRAVYALYEAFAASVIFMLVPDSAISRISSLFPSSSSGYGFFRAREYTRRRVALAGKAFRRLFEISKTFSGPDNGQDPSVIYRRVSDDICRSCRDSSRCWQQYYRDTSDIMNNLTPMLMTKGSILKSDIPDRFISACKSPDALIGALNRETSFFLMRRRYHRQLCDNRNNACLQYADMAGVLSSLSDELGGEITVETGLERKLAKYLHGLDMDASVAVFRISSGRLRAEIKSESLYILFRLEDYLDRLSQVLGTRLCTCDDEKPFGRLVLLEAEPISVRAGMASSKCSGESVNGDRGTCFRTEDGSFFAVISDGMGTGAAAAKVSGDVTSAIQLMLHAGISPELSLSLISNLMLMKNETDTESATIDLFCLDMFSGSAVIHKLGAAPTYLKSGGVVKKVPGSGFPAGLVALDRHKNGGSKIKLSPGSTVLMISDGILSGNEDKWLREMLCSCDEDDPAELARAIIRRAGTISGPGDDMTVIVLFLDRRM